jgi:hypothetical protein
LEPKPATSLDKELNVSSTSVSQWMGGVAPKSSSLEKISRFLQNVDLPSSPAQVHKAER